MGHLLATGILSDAEAKIVADRLVHPSMSSGFGLRTMASTAGGYSPLSYHCGSVWPHDTAIAVQGLITAGFPAHPTALAKGCSPPGLPSMTGCRNCSAVSPPTTCRSPSRPAGVLPATGLGRRRRRGDG